MRKASPDPYGSKASPDPYGSLTGVLKKVSDPYGCISSTDFFTRLFQRLHVHIENLGVLQSLT